VVALHQILPGQETPGRLKFSHLALASLPASSDCRLWFWSADDVGSSGALCERRNSPLERIMARCLGGFFVLVPDLTSPSQTRPLDGIGEPGRGSWPRIACFLAIWSESAMLCRVSRFPHMVWDGILPGVETYPSQSDCSSSVHLHRPAAGTLKILAGHLTVKHRDTCSTHVTEGFFRCVEWTGILKSSHQLSASATSGKLPPFETRGVACALEVKTISIYVQYTDTHCLWFKVSFLRVPHEVLDICLV
jgi:hypothetical protein